MSDSESDGDYCPTDRDQKEFDKEVGVNDDRTVEQTSGMTAAESAEAEEILNSFKTNKPLKQKTIEKKKETPVIKSYDFAGETVNVDEETGLEHSVDVPQYERRQHIPRRRKVSGLDMILSGKKPKLSLIKKTKMDWNAHKKAEHGLEEELNNVKHSKQSKVERDDFLARTDYRTFERERDERLKRINNRKLTG